MIHLKNEAEVLLVLSDLGAAAAAIDQSADIVPFDGVITAVLAQEGVVGVDGTGAPTQDVLYDVNKNNTTLIATKLTWTHTALGVAPSSYGSFVGVAPIAVSKGDVISLDCDQILNGTTPTQPKNLVVTLKITRSRAPRPANIITGSLE